MSILTVYVTYLAIYIYIYFKILLTNHFGFVVTFAGQYHVYYY